MADGGPTQSRPRGFSRADSALEIRLRDEPNTKNEFKTLLKLALPTIVQTGCQQAMAFTDQIFLGHLGTEEMAAAALGNMYAAFLTFFLFGTATALDTLGAQAYGASKIGVKGTTLVTWCFTSFVVLSALCIPASIGLGLGYPVARGILRQDVEISRLVEEYCAGLIAGVWPLMWSMVLMKYLQVQNVMIAPAIVAAFTFALNIGANFVFIDEFGFKGAPWATSFSRLVQFIMLCVMVYYYQHCHGRPQHSRLYKLIFHDADDVAGRQQESDDEGSPQLAMPPMPLSRNSQALDRDAADPCDSSMRNPQLVPQRSTAAPGLEAALPPSTRVSDTGYAAKPHMSPREIMRFVWYESKEGVKPRLLLTYLKLGLPGGIMMACEQGSFDVTTALAGQLGATVVAAHSAMLNIVQLTFVSCPFAVGIAGSIRVGNLLGEALPRTARQAGWICVAIGGTFMAVCAIVIISTRDVIGRIFSKDAEVVAIAATLAPMVALFQVSDGLMGCAQGVLRGCGKQRLLMIYNIVGFWLCGVLVGYLLCFHADLGVKGLWWGIACGDTTTAILNLVTLALINWKHQSEVAKKLLGVHHHDADALPPGGADEEAGWVVVDRQQQQHSSTDSASDRTGPGNGVSEGAVELTSGRQGASPSGQDGQRGAGRVDSISESQNEARQLEKQPLLQHSEGSTGRTAAGKVAGRCAGDTGVSADGSAGKVHVQGVSMVADAAVSSGLSLTARAG